MNLPFCLHCNVLDFMQTSRMINHYVETNSCLKFTIVSYLDQYKCLDVRYDHNKASIDPRTTWRV